MLNSDLNVWSEDVSVTNVRLTANGNSFHYWVMYNGEPMQPRGRKYLFQDMSPNMTDALLKKMFAFFLVHENIRFPPVCDPLNIKK